MKAGVAKVDITPPLGTRMWGYFDRLAGAEGILDPLYARVLVLETGDKRLAYVDLDLGRTFGPASLDRLRTAAKQTAAIDDLIVQATHTHAGPVILDEYPNGTPTWETDDLDRIARAIANAAEHAVPVRIGVGYGAAYIGYNRREVASDGAISMLWSNSTKAPTWPVDPLVAVLRVDQLDGQPLAILVNYATHPVTFGSDDLRYSADFPGIMCQVVERAFGDKPLAFFVQGAPAISTSSMPERRSILTSSEGGIGQVKRSARPRSKRHNRFGPPRIPIHGSISRKDQWSSNFGGIPKNSVRR